MLEAGLEVTGLHRSELVTLQRPAESGVYCVPCRASAVPAECFQLFPRVLSSCRERRAFAASEEKTGGGRWLQPLARVTLASQEKCFTPSCGSRGSPGPPRTLLKDCLPGGCGDQVAPRLPAGTGPAFL